MGQASTVRRSAVLSALLLGAAVVVAATAGCSALTDTPTLTATDSGSSLVLITGDEFVVELDSNPSTGYAWDLDGELPEAVELVGEPEYIAPNTDAVGAAGIERWTFRATGEGTGEVYLRYWRSFDPETESEETFTFEVTVREP